MQLTHLAIIPDGNRRWAKERGLPTLEGHRKGYAKFKNLADWALEAGITHLSVWAFSTENWNRSKEEVGYLMELIELAVTKEVKRYNKRGIRLNVVGSRERLPETLVAAIERAEEETQGNTKGQLNLCLNYGGQAEILEATKELLRQGVDPESLTSEMFTAATWLKDVPPVDLIVRTSGEQRLSGFMSWSGGYSELYFMDKNFPDMEREDFDAAVEAFSTRKRRYGA